MSTLVPFLARVWTAVSRRLVPRKARVECARCRRLLHSRRIASRSARPSWNSCTPQQHVQGLAALLWRGERFIILSVSDASFREPTPSSLGGRWR
eukprot:1091318-Pleurochrysis_carterae.AAC.1